MTGSSSQPAAEALALADHPSPSMKPVQAPFCGPQPGLLDNPWKAPGSHWHMPSLHQLLSPKEDYTRWHGLGPPGKGILGCPSEMGRGARLKQLKWSESRKGEGADIFAGAGGHYRSWGTGQSVHTAGSGQGQGAGEIE